MRPFVRGLDAIYIPKTARHAMSPSVLYCIIIMRGQQITTLRSVGTYSTLLAVLSALYLFIKLYKAPVPVDDTVSQ